MISVQRLQEADFAGLRDEWTALLHSARSGSPMLTWEWMFSWWEAYRAAEVRRELYLLAVRNGDGTLVGLAPFVHRPCRQCGVTLRRLEFMGTGELERDETCSEFLDLIAADGREREVGLAVADHLLADDGWDEVVCRDVRQDASTAVRSMGDRLTARGELRGVEFGAARCPYIPLPASWDAYLAALSRNSRRIVRHKRRQLEAAPGVQFRSAEAPEDVREAFPAFWRLHQQRWQDNGRSGCFGSSVFADFMTRLTPRLAACGGVRIASLSIGTDLAAAYYLLCHGGSTYYYNSGVALKPHGELSPGSVCLGYIVEDAIRRHEKEFHLFKGGPDSYKYHWTEWTVPVASLLVRRKGWKHAICASGARLAGWARAARQVARRSGPSSVSTTTAAETRRDQEPVLTVQH